MSHDTEDRCTASLPGNILNVNNKFPFGEKAVTQTYDGAAVIADRCEGLRKLIGDKYATVVEELKTNLMSLVIFISLIICSTCFGH